MFCYPPQRAFRTSIVLLSIFIGLYSQASAEENNRSNFAISVSPASTIGVGLNVHYRLSNHFAMKAGHYFLPLNVQDIEYEDEEENTYLTNGSLDFSNSLVGVDYFPFKKTFKLTLGYVLLDSSLNLRATPEGGELTLDDTTYDTSTEINSIDIYMSMPDSGLYSGFGWGNPTRPNQRWGFSLDIGAIFLPEGPEFSIAANCVENALTCHQIETSLEEDESIIQNDLDEFTIYPLINLAVSYQL